MVGFGLRRSKVLDISMGVGDRISWWVLERNSAGKIEVAG
jgi:hypothetical protein